MSVFKPSRSFRPEDQASIYSPIDTTKHEIRLFLLAAGDETEPPSGVLLNYSISDRPEYNALSYTWGDDSIKIPITVNGCPFMVTGNLYAALQKVQHPELEPLLWIDAICIEQSNLEERSRHVTYMHLVYKSAAVVIVWLGRASEDSDVAFDQVEAITQECFPFPDDKDAQSAKLASAMQSVVTNTTYGRHRRDPWRPLANLFGRPWWKRIWIVQEVVFGSIVEVLCGDRNVSMQHLMLISEAFRHLYWHSPHLLSQHPALMSTGTTLQLAATDLPAQLLGLQTMRQEGEVLTLEYVLTRLARIRNCSDPRDRVFGLMNLVAQEHWPREPDYRISVKEVFKRATLKIMELRRDLRVLASSEASVIGVWPVSDSHLRDWMQYHATPDLPSWIPDWARIRVTISLAGGIGQHRTPEGFTNSLTSEKSSCNSAMWQLVDDDTLLVHGFHIDTVEAVSKLYVSKGYDTRLPGLIDEISDFLHQKSPSTTTLEAKASNEWKILIDDLNPQAGQLAFGKHASPTKEEYMTWRLSRRREVPEAVSDAIFRRLGGRIVFVTQCGYQGLGHIVTRPGDVVSWVMGCHVPLVLRPSTLEVGRGTRYNIVGEAYVLGAMDGELVCRFRADGCESVDILLI